MSMSRYYVWPLDLPEPELLACAYGTFKVGLAATMINIAPHRILSFELKPYNPKT